MSDSDSQDPTKKTPSTQLQGVNQLIVDAIVNMTSIVESMHHRISPVSTITRSASEERARGVSGLVYKGIRSLTEQVGKGLDVPLGIIGKSMNGLASSSKREALVSALNGVLGDHLVKRENPLAIPMTLRQGGKVIDDFTSLAEAVQRAHGRLVILAHGLCMNDLQWQREGHNHGAAITTDLGYPAIYLHYNSGQHISENGIEFSHILEALLSQIKSHIDHSNLQISIVAHSMGGLVTRSAFEQAKSLSHQWPKHLKDIIFLGTPHHGAPLEKAGGWIDMLLGIHSYTSPLTKLTNVRSAGINDLRHGYIVKSDWQARGRFDFAVDKRVPLSLPEGVNCYTIGTTSTTGGNKLSEKLVGDGLVPLDSALGKHSDGRFTLHFPKGHSWIGRDINHMQLLSSTEVYYKIQHWLREDE